MPRTVSAAEKSYAISLMIDGVGQRDISRKTGLSRPYLRKIAKMIGHQFPRNGVEVVGMVCVCGNCGAFFRRSASKVRRAKIQYCDTVCKKAFMQGPNHPAWKTGKTATTFSKWILNQTGYKKWRTAVLEKDGYKCAISGRTDKLEAHHILPKAEDLYSELSLDPNNGITVNKEVHTRIHEIIREGYGFEEAVEKVKEEYKTHEDSPN